MDFTISGHDTMIMVAMYTFANGDCETQVYCEVCSDFHRPYLKQTNSCDGLPLANAERGTNVGVEDRRDDSKQKSP